MSRQSLNIGNNPNDGTGDLLRAAMQKIESNFIELYNTRQDIDFAPNSIGTTAGDVDFNITTSGSGRLSVEQGIKVNTGTENSASEFLAFDGTVQLYVDPINKRIGINTNTPTNSLTVVGAANITGNLQVAGNFTAGNSSSDVLALNAQIQGNVVPNVSGFSLGSNTNIWSNAYVSTIQATSISTTTISGSLTGNVVGNVVGNVAGNVTGNVAGNQITADLLRLRSGVFFNQINTESLTSTQTISFPDRSGSVVIARPAPASSIGLSTDRVGHVAFDNNYVYCCTADFDGSSAIWKRATLESW